MTTTRLFPSIVLGILLGACAGKVPETRYYQLASPPADTKHEEAGVVLAIEPLETEQAYDDERIVYRVTPYRLDYYNYHRWSSAPGLLIADYLERSFESSGRFRSVTRDANAAAATLSGRVVAIEEVDESKTKWTGRLVIELKLVDPEGKVLWTEQYEEREPLKTQTPEGLAAALSNALHRISANALPVVADLTTQSAQEVAAAANAKSLRAARR